MDEDECKVEKKESTEEMMMNDWMMWSSRKMPKWTIKRMLLQTFLLSNPQSFASYQPLVILNICMFAFREGLERPLSSSLKANMHILKIVIFFTLLPHQYLLHEEEED